MIPQKSGESHHNTQPQVREYLGDALAIVADLELDDDLKVAAFNKACDLLSAKQVFYEQIQPGIPNMAIPRGL